MNNFKSFLLSCFVLTNLLFTIASSYLYSAEYKLSSLDMETIAGVNGWWYGACFGINDQGQVFGVGLSEGKPSVYFIDQTKEVTFIDSKNQILNPIALNNLGQIAGTVTERGNKHSLFMWSKNFGVKNIDIFTGLLTNFAKSA